MKTAVNERLRFLREDLGITREQLAMISSVSSSTITKIENGSVELSQQQERKLVAVLKPNTNWWNTGKGSNYYAEGTKEQNAERLASLLNGNAITNPWRDEAYAIVKEENTSLREQVKMLMQTVMNLTGGSKGQANFLKALENAYGIKLFPNVEQFATVSGANLRARA